MRTTLDLIKELAEEANNFTGVALAVGFEHTTTFIFANQAEPLKALNAAIEAGGYPIGFMGWDMNNGLLTVQVRPIAEVCEDPETGRFVQDHMKRLCASFKAELESNYPGVTSDLKFPGEE